MGLRADFFLVPLAVLRFAAAGRGLAAAFVGAGAMVATTVEVAAGSV